MNGRPRRTHQNGPTQSTNRAGRAWVWSTRLLLLVAALFLLWLALRNTPLSDIARTLAACPTVASWRDPGRQHPVSCAHGSALVVPGSCGHQAGAPAGHGPRPPGRVRPELLHARAAARRRAAADPFPAPPARRLVRSGDRHGHHGSIGRTPGRISSSWCWALRPCCTRACCGASQSLSLALLIPLAPGDGVARCSHLPSVARALSGLGHAWACSGTSGAEEDLAADPRRGAPRGQVLPAKARRGPGRAGSLSCLRPVWQ